MLFGTEFNRFYLMRSLEQLWLRMINHHIAWITSCWLTTHSPTPPPPPFLFLLFPSWVQYLHYHGLSTERFYGASHMYSQESIYCMETYPLCSIPSSFTSHLALAILSTYLLKHLQSYTFETISLCKYFQMFNPHCSSINNLTTNYFGFIFLNWICKCNATSTWIAMGMHPLTNSCQ